MNKTKLASLGLGYLERSPCERVGWLSSLSSRAA